MRIQCFTCDKYVTNDIDDDRLRLRINGVVAYEYEFGYWIHIASEKINFDEKMDFLIH